MTLLALTQNNIAFIKSSLRRSYPTARSSHLSEALAAACGFRTNIALATSLRAGAFRPSGLIDIDSGRFVARLVELGYPMEDGAALVPIVRSQEMPERVWLVRKGRNLSPLNGWLDECYRRNIPCVHITNRRIFARIDWDCIVLDSKYDEVTNGEGDDLVDEMHKAFLILAKDGPRNSFFRGSPFAGTIDNIPTERAPDFADAMFRILHNAVREWDLRGMPTVNVLNH